MGTATNGKHTGGNYYLTGVSNLLVDYHIHPEYSIDAQPHGIGEYCRMAVKMGLQEICFTPHFEVDPRRRHLDWFVRLNGRMVAMESLNWVEQFFKDIDTAKKEYRDLLTVRAGLEVGYEPGQENAIENILNAYPFDFVLGSIHCMEHIAISSRSECRQYFQGKDPLQVCRDYYAIMDKAVETGLFDCMAHLDLYRRYGQLFYGDKINKCHARLVEPVFSKMAAQNIALEINTSSRRRGLKQFHPSEPLFQEAVRCGINKFTVGSDAHKLGELGDGISDAVNFLKDYDFKPTTYKLRHPVE